MVVGFGSSSGSRLPMVSVMHASIPTLDSLRTLTAEALGAALRSTVLVRPREITEDTTYCVIATPKPCARGRLR